MVTLEEHYNELTVLGLINDIKSYQCQVLADYLTNKTKLKVNFVLLFETQFDDFRENLLKESLEFSSHSQPPIIYEKSKTGYKILGSLENFVRWASAYHFFVEQKLSQDFIDKQFETLRKKLDKQGNKYVYFTVKIGEDEPSKKIVFELFYPKLPKTCENFLKICEGFKTKNNEHLTYEKTIFHRIVKDSFIQGGDLSSLKIKNQKSIYDEGEFADENFSIKHDSKGLIGMVKKNGRPHSNESQFYITLSEISSFDKKFVAFGRVIQGYDVVLKIAGVETYIQKPLVKVVITKCGEYKF